MEQVILFQQALYHGVHQGIGFILGAGGQVQVEIFVSVALFRDLFFEVGSTPVTGFTVDEAGPVDRAGEVDEAGEDVHAVHHAVQGGDSAHGKAAEGPVGAGILQSLFIGGNGIGGKGCFHGRDQIIAQLKAKGFQQAGIHVVGFFILVVVIVRRTYHNHRGNLMIRNHVIQDILHLTGITG